MKNILTILLVIVQFPLIAQNKYIDSLEKWLNDHPDPDTLRVMTTHRLSYRLSEINKSRSWFYASETMNLAKQLNFKKGECVANINFAILESNQANYVESSNYYLKAIDIAEKIDYVRGRSISYNNLSENYLDMKNYPLAIQYSNKALMLNSSIKDKRGQAINYEQIGSIYYNQGDLQSAKKYWDLSYPLAKESKDGNIYSQVLIDLGKYHTRSNSIDMAMNYLQEAERIATESSELLSQVLTYKEYANLFNSLNKPEESFRYLHKALLLTGELNHKAEQCEIYNLFSLAFERNKQYDSGIFYLRKHKLLSDTVLIEKNIDHVAFLQTKHETELKEKENRKLKSIQAVQTRTISEKNILLLLISVALTLAVLSILLIFRNFKNKKRQGELVEQNRLSLYNQQVAELEVKSLRSQMNPHFLFNSLNSIRNYIIKNEPQIASNYLADFATLMRKILDSSQQNKISLEEEVSTLTLYLNLELMRFSNGFKYKFIVDPELESEDINIPSMVIQPFVENAIWHGLLNKEEGECMLIISFKENLDNISEVICEIEDNGIGREQSTKLQSTLKKHKSKGIHITRERLRRLTQNEDVDPIQFHDLKDTQGYALGTRVVLHLPVM